MIVLACGVLALVAFLLVHLDYYLLPPSGQALHPDHAALRSSGRLGLLFGMLGTAMILLNLLYLVRRRLIRWRWPGSLRSWMDFHIASGIFSAALVALHSTLRPRGALGTTAAAALAVVIVTGVIGRYLYSRIPRSIEGRELRLNEVRERYGRLLASLERFGIRLDLTRLRTKPYGSKLRAFVGLILGDPRIRRQYGEARRILQVSSLDPASQARILPVLRRMVSERASIQRYEELHALMASWRFLHRWLALVMIGSVVAHVAFAVLFGDLWILGGGG